MNCDGIDRFQSPAPDRVSVVELDSRLPVSSEVDIVLCDYEMPGLNGLQLVRLLRSSWSRLELPILMLTVRPSTSASRSAMSPVATAVTFTSPVPSSPARRASASST